MFRLFLFILLSTQFSYAKEQNQKPLAANKSSAVRQYLETQLQIEDVNKFLLTDKLRDTLNAGFEGIEGSAFNSDGILTEAGKNALLSQFSEQSKTNLTKLILSLGKDTYNNAMIIGSGGVGKTFLSNQAIATLSFGIVPEFLESDLGYDSDNTPFLSQLREHYIGNTQFVLIDDDLLSRDNTRQGQAFAKAEVRMRSLLIDLFKAAEEDFRKTGVRTVYLLEEVAELPPQVQPTLKKLLDPSGFKGNSNDPMDRGSEIGVSVWGVTTPGEYRAMVVSDSAVDRRYERVLILEPNEQKALEILQKKRDKWFDRYHLYLDDDVLSYIISMRKFFSNPPLAMPDSILKIFSRSSDLGISP